MSRLATNWSNRLIPRNASLRMRTVQASLITSTVLATAHSRWASDFRLIVHHNSRFQVATHFILRYVYRVSFKVQLSGDQAMSERRYKIPFPVRVYPGLTWRAWLTPPPIGSRTLEKDREATADLTPLDGYEGFEAGSGPLVLALHGWGGRAAQMAPVARRLAAEGYRVVAPELPSRAGAPITDIKKVAAVVTGMIDRLGFPEVVIAHSFAAVVMRVVFVDRGPRLAVIFGPAL